MRIFGFLLLLSLLSIFTYDIINTIETSIVQQRILYIEEEREVNWKGVLNGTS